MSSLELQDLVGGPGIDPRQWCSYGTVDDETADTKSVEFTSLGPIVRVTLQPSGSQVRCRVAGWCAGVGEAEYFPFVGGDEVLVAVPEGDERAYPAITHRLNQEIDTFPTVVGGADTTKNSVAFRRVRTPFIFETASSYLLTSAATGAFFVLDVGGNLTLSDGTKGFVHVGADFIGMQSGDANLILQLDLQHQYIVLEYQGETKLLIQPDPSLTTSGVFSLSASGMATSEHAISVEAVVNILAQLGLLVAVPWTELNVAAAVTAAAAAPITPATLGAITAALGTKTLNSTGLLPGVGCPGFLIG